MDQNVLDFARANPGRLYIDGDEPDQWCVAPTEYAAMYHQFVAAVRGADPTARVSPAGFAEPNYKCCPPPDDVPQPCWSAMHSTGYADQFYKAYVQLYGVVPPVDEWRFHDFGVSFAAGDMDGWWARVESEAAWSVAHGANMILGSWGFPGWRGPAPEFQEQLKQALGRLMNDGRINGAAYWTREPWVQSPHYLMETDGSLTSEGQTFVNPLTDIPAAAKIVSSANGLAKLRWTNTTSAWAAEAEFWVQASGSSSFVYHSTERVASLGANQTSFVVFKSGDSVKARVRYYNVYGQAEWSPFSSAVVMGEDDPEADQGRVSRRNPIFCMLQLC